MLHIPSASWLIFKTILHWCSLWYISNARKLIVTTNFFLLGHVIEKQIAFEWIPNWGVLQIDTGQVTNSSFFIDAASSKQLGDKFHLGISCRLGDWTSPFERKPHKMRRRPVGERFSFSSMNARMGFCHTGRCNLAINKAVMKLKGVYWLCRTWPYCRYHAGLPCRLPLPVLWRNLSSLISRALNTLDSISVREAKQPSGIKLKDRLWTVNQNHQSWCRSS